MRQIIFNRKIVSYFLILLFMGTTTYASRNKKNSDREAVIDQTIHSTVKHLHWEKWEVDALNRKAVIGMPQLLFDAVMASWNCESHPTGLKGDAYRNQYICFGAFSKKPHELQGKYFYTEGRILRRKPGQARGNVFDGELTGIQGD